MTWTMTSRFESTAARLDIEAMLHRPLTTNADQLQEAA